MAVDYRRVFLASRNREEFKTERAAQKDLCRLLVGREEVWCKPKRLGRIDILTRELIIEVKKYTSHNAKCAIGQVLVYHALHPHLTPTIALIGKPVKLYNEVGKTHGLNVFWALPCGKWEIGHLVRKKKCKDIT